ncbi:MAG: DegV family protein [Clostridia bacterium]|nr:DegV family protein [Clostridia bacterium]
MIKILVDSASDCRKQYGKYDLFMPISINIDGTEYRDGVDIDANGFYKLLMSCVDFPKTSQPSPQAFLEIFEQIKADGDELIYFALSSKLSGTYQGACIAKDMTDYDGIHIIDTRTATHMIGLLADHAHRLINAGLSAKEIVKQCEKLKSRVKVLAGLDTLEYLYRGGRLSKTSATVGKIADIKPIITVSENGTVEVVGKMLGKARAMNSIVQKLNSIKLDKDFPLYSLYTFGEENCEGLEQKLKDEGYEISRRLQVGSTIGAHIGPGVYAVLFVTEQNS